MSIVTIGTAEMRNVDCMEFMSGLPDKAFELALVDPPYGIGASESFAGETRKSGNGCALKTAFEKKLWDSAIPNKDYFEELKRVSKNQIIWGANYMTNFLPASMGWIVWDKDNGTTNFSDCELAYTSFDIALRKFLFTWNGMIQGDMKNKEQRIHPTQKPIKLYEWLLTNYAKPGDRILDTHLGSMSSVIACLNLGFEVVGCELDSDYFKAGCERVAQSQRQVRMFA
jgi:site-specific DNA-methyltransferase (adenine-specific)